MESKKGIVISVEKKFVSILTCDGEFLNVYVDNERNIPNIGEEYEGLLTKKGTISSNLFKYAAACLIFFMILSGGSAYAYYTPVSTIVVNINPSLEMKLNRWDRVIDVKPLNEDGVKLLKEINIKNDVVDKALMEILERSEKDKFINEDYTKENKIVTLNIEGKKDVDLSGFKKEIDKEKLNLRIDKNGTVIFNKTNSDKNYNAEDKKVKEPGNGEDTTNNNLINSESTVNNDKNIKDSGTGEKNIEGNNKAVPNKDNLKKSNENTNVKENEKNSNSSSEKKTNLKEKTINKDNKNKEKN
ncbi:hypothetical protein Ccar_07385 [Clostridium carboxidivorans P7]|uniref:anti-sigma-I factor RsgI family protein n=1 Tax=Clostridium carboxidivorans TaxID=217159 RepID=UPI0001D394CD|nr:hypothetical protein [Clostridium carboxidivorans]AKN30661.1 hypothetical protein Ccar_07385 [Clostridium carboxidivorans P7]EFG86420.1 hypothetical protein CLCAR_4246 [Clostridium carboxidivorans P7]